MNKTLAFTLVMIPCLAIQAPASRQNNSVKPPQENSNSQESKRDLPREKGRKSPRRKAAKPRTEAPRQVSPASRKDRIQPDYIDYPLLRQKDEKAPVDKDQ